MNYTLESFIDFCDEIDIAEEGLFSKNKSKEKPQIKKPNETSKPVKVYFADITEIGDKTKKDYHCYTTEPEAVYLMLDSLIKGKATLTDSNTLWIDNSMKSVLNKKVYIYTSNENVDRLYWVVKKGATATKVRESTVEEVLGKKYKIKIVDSRAANNKKLVDNLYKYTKQTFSGIKQVSVENIQIDHDADGNEKWYDMDMFCFNAGEKSNSKLPLFDWRGDEHSDIINEVINPRVSLIEKKFPQFKFTKDHHKLEGTCYVSWK